MHAPQDCASGLPNLDDSAYGVYEELGDFDAQSPAAERRIAIAGVDLPEIGAAARALLVNANDHDRQWQGVVEVPPQGPVDVLLLPALTSCAFHDAIHARTTPTVAPVAPTGGEGVLLVGGTLTDSSPGPTGSAANAAAPTLLLRLDTGSLQPVAPDLFVSRDRATVTPFARGALVAAGAEAATGAIIDTAEIFDSEIGGFDRGHVIPLHEARADAGAVVLATGETLLVGGVGSDGKTAIDSMEIVDPITRTARAQNVARLAVARSGSTVLRLASGEILVAGGVDSGGVPVPTLEWFAADASKPSKRPQILVSGSGRRAYTALEAGGALAVIAPPATADATFQNVWVIGADGALEPATPLGGSLTRPVLFGRAGGAPVLWTGDRWLRWAPWLGAFGALFALDDVPAQVGAATASPDPGLALWFDATTSASNPRMTALRFDVRGDYSPLPGPLLVSDPGNLSPDRLAADGVLSFDAGTGLTLAPGASAFIDDRTYADVNIELDAPTGQPALVVLRGPLGTELEVGGPSCAGSIVTGAPSSLTVERRGANVTWTLSGGGPSKTCTGAIGAADRISIGVRGAPDLSRSAVRNLRVARSGSP